MKTQLTISRRRADAGRLHPEILPAAGRDARKLRLRRGLLVRTRRAWANAGGNSSATRRSTRCVERALANNRDVAVAAARVAAGPGQPQDRAGAIPAADRRRKPPPRANIRPRRRSCSRMPSSRPSRGSCRCSGRCATPNAPQRPRSRPRPNGRWRASAFRWPPRSPRPISRCWNTSATFRSPVRPSGCGANRPR